MFSHAISTLEPLSPSEIPEPGHMLELSGSPSSGKATLALGLCAEVLRQGKAAAWIDAGMRFCPMAALESGEPLERLLVLRLSDCRAALRGAQLLLACPGAVALLVLDLPPGARIHDANLVKLQRLAERSGTALVFVTERAPHQPSMGALVSMRLHVGPSGRAAASRRGLAVEVLRNKGGATQRRLEAWAHGPDRLRVHSTL
jgi:hypothetical protein